MRQFRETFKQPETITNKNQITEGTVRRFYDELSGIRKVKKCKTCVCFCESMRDLWVVLGTIDEKRLEKLRGEVAEWLVECEKAKLHDCLGCNPCLPVKPLTEFHEAFNRKNAIS